MLRHTTLAQHWNHTLRHLDCRLQENHARKTATRQLRFQWPAQQTQNICIIFVKRRSNVFDVGPTLYKCYPNVLCLLGGPGVSTSESIGSVPPREKWLTGPKSGPVKRAESFPSKEIASKSPSEMEWEGDARAPGCSCFQDDKNVRTSCVRIKYPDEARILV